MKRLAPYTVTVEKRLELVLRLGPGDDAGVAVAGAGERPQEGDRLVEGRDAIRAVYIQADEDCFQAGNSASPPYRCGVASVSALHAFRPLCDHFRVDRLGIPQGLRPGMLGLLLVRRVIMGDIAATIVDLAERGFVAVNETDSGWSVRVVPARMPVNRQQGLLAYERQLLAELPMPTGGQPAPTLPGLAATLGPGLNRVRTEVVREAVRQGWVHRWSHGQLTDSGERFAAQVSAFGRRLRRLSGDGGADILADALLPYALRFHLVPRDQISLAAFAAAWAEAFTDLPGWRPPGHRRPERDEWYNPQEAHPLFDGYTTFW